MDIVFTIMGLVILFAGGELLLKASLTISKKLGLSALLVSMIVIGFGTSTPELMVSLSAALKGTTDIAFGNVVGSNIANVLLILGSAAVITPVLCQRREIRRDAIVVFGACALLSGFSFFGMLERWMGLVMLLILAGYMGYSYRQENNNKAAQEDVEEFEEELGGHIEAGWPLTIALTVISLGCLAGGAWLLVEGASSIATKMGIPEAVIGLTLVALGSSLPELTMAVLAATRKNTDIIIGNVMGSNLFNTLGILGITSVAIPLPFPEQIAAFDIWLMLLIMAVLIPVVWTGHRISRLEGAFFLCAYTGYVVWLYV